MKNVEKNVIDDALFAQQNNDLLFVAAAGNSGPNYNTIKYPAAYHKVVAVAAVDSGLNVASFSSRGIDNWEYGKDRLVEVSGPGVAIESTMKDGGLCHLEWNIYGNAPHFWAGRKRMEFFS